MVKAYTDYPLSEGEERRVAPIREVEIKAYDGDKYVEIEYEKRRYTVKAGYLYESYGRLGDVEPVPLSVLEKLK